MSEIGSFVILYMNITFWIQIIFLGLWFIFPRQHNCGPIENGQYGWQPVETWIEAVNVLKQIYVCITFYPILWNIALLLVLLATFNRNKAQVYELYVKARKTEMTGLIKNQLREIGRQKRKLEFQKALEVS